MQNQNHTSSYLWNQERMYTHIRHKHTNVPHKSAFKKPGAPGYKSKEKIYLLSTRVDKGDLQVWQVLI